MQSWPYWHNKWNTFIVYMVSCTIMIYRTRDARVYFSHSLFLAMQTLRSRYEIVWNLSLGMIMGVILMYSFFHTLASSCGAVYDLCDGLIGLCLQLRVPVNVFSSIWLLLTHSSKNQSKFNMTTIHNNKHTHSLW